MLSAAVVIGTLKVKTEWVHFHMELFYYSFFLPSVLKVSVLKVKNLLLWEQILSFKSGLHFKELSLPEENIKLVENAEVGKSIHHFSKDSGRGLGHV